MSPYQRRIKILGPYNKAQQYKEKMYIDLFNITLNEMRKNIIIFQLAVLMCFGSIKLDGQDKWIKPGENWNDTKGNPINAHGGGVIWHGGTYYWFGEIKKGKTWRVPYINTWECYRTDAGGVSCYSSKDLGDWKYEGVALAPDLSDSTNDLHISKVIERPKVIYNEKTKKFVMWMHIDTEDYSYARAGVAVSDNPTGPYTYLYSISPDGQMSRDMTLFKDEDGSAYHIYSSENNSTLHISLLTNDYLKPSGSYERIMENNFREAPAMFKWKGKYYLITSACTGWEPNAAVYSVADSIKGKWKTIGNPCEGQTAETTFLSQSTYVIPVKGKTDSYIFMADRWNKTNLENSRYIWLPFKMNDNKPVIAWIDKWNLSFFER
jgi:hypothetical protein